MPLGIQEDVLWFKISIYDVLLMEVLDGEAELCYIEFGLIFWEGDLTSQVKAQVSSGAVVESKVEVVRGLEGEMKVYDELMVRLLEDVGLNYRVF